MKTVFEHIEHVKGKPHHIRKKVAFTAALSLTALVALVWLVGSLSFGNFAIQGSSFADATQQGVLDVSSPTVGTQNIAGAAAAFGNEDAPARIEIVDTAPPQAKKPEATVIPF